MRLAWCLVALGVIGCGDDDGAAPRDAGRAEDSGGPREDAGSTPGVDGGPRAHECEAQRDVLEGIVEQAAAFDALTTEPRAQRLAAVIVRVEHLRQVSVLTAAGLEQVLGDPADPVHTSPGGADFLRGALDRERARAAGLAALAMRARAEAAAAGYADLAAEDRPRRVVDAVWWAELEARASAMLARCAAEGESVPGDEVGDVVADAAMVANDAHSGHEVARAAVVRRLLAGGAP